MVIELEVIGASLRGKSIQPYINEIFKVNIVENKADRYNFAGSARTGAIVIL